VQRTSGPGGGPEQQYPLDRWRHDTSTLTGLEQTVLRRLSVMASETAEVADDFTDCSTCNFPSIGSGLSKGPGSGRYITFTLDTPVPLATNTTYGFDVAGGDVRHYWETDGRDFTPGGPGGGSTTDPYTSGKLIRVA
jgi:hypothetical protein